jgi:hypothetical protein
LLTATTVMLLLPDPRRLMLGYWLGAMTTSITLGLVIVFALEGSGSVNTAKRTLSPAADIALGALALLVALVLGTGRDRPVAERRAARRRDKRPPRWQQKLSEGTARTTFVIGVLLTLPGASYLAGLSRISKLDYPTASSVLVVIGFNLVMLALLEVPLVAFSVEPKWSVTTMARIKDWAAAHGRRYAAWGLGLVGVALIGKGIVGLLQ